MKIGQIGAGELGSAIGKNLIKAGHSLFIYDANPQATATMAEQDAMPIASAAELAAHAEIVVTVLPTPAIIEEVMVGSGGVLNAMQPGSTWIDHSTNDRELLLRIQELAIARQIGVIEAPVTGGIPLAHAGKITVLAGADRTLFERHQHLLEAIGEPVIHMGPVGSATTVKLLTNMLAFIHLWALGEGLMLGTAAGLETGAVFEAIKASCGNSFVAETEGPPILAGDYDYGFTMDLAGKDIGLVMDLATQHGVPLEMGGLVQQLLLRGKARYGGDFWSTGIVKLLEDDMGIDLRADGYAAAERWLPYDRGAP